MICKRCGSLIPNENLFCDKCGAVAKSINQEDNKRIYNNEIVKKKIGVVLIGILAVGISILVLLKVFGGGADDALQKWIDAATSANGEKIYNLMPDEVQEGHDKLEEVEDISKDFTGCESIKIIQEYEGNYIDEAKKEIGMEIEISEAKKYLVDAYYPEHAEGVSMLVYVVKCDGKWCVIYNDKAGEKHYSNG